MANTPNVAAPLWAAAQASPWLTQNQAARIWDAFSVNVIVERMDLTAAPVSCNDGARYLVHGVATGLWTGHEGELAIAVGANASNGWYFAEIGLEGMLLFNRADAHNYRYHLGAWSAFADAVSRFQDLLDVTLTSLVDGDVFVWDASNGQLFPQTVGNLVAGILASYVQATLDPDGTLAADSDARVATQKAMVTYIAAQLAGTGGGATLDTDGTLAANSDTRVPSQKAVKTYVDAKVSGLLALKGGLDCSASPNYPVAAQGDYYYVTVGGKVGGGSGTVVSTGDIFFAKTANGGGTQAAVGSSWDVIRSGSDFVVGVSRLQDLSDVDLSGLADGLVLKYDASNGTFYFAQTYTPFASAAEVQAMQESGKAIAPDQLAKAAKPQTLADGATITWDMSLGFNAKVTLGATGRTLAIATSSTALEGVTYRLEVIQDGSGSRTITTWPTSFDWGGAGVPTLSTGASKHDFVYLDCYDATVGAPKFRAAFNKGS